MRKIWGFEWPTSSERRGGDEASACTDLICHHSKAASVVKGLEFLPCKDECKEPGVQCKEQWFSSQGTFVQILGKSLTLL